MNTLKAQRNASYLTRPQIRVLDKRGNLIDGFISSEAAYACVNDQKTHFVVDIGTIQENNPAPAQAQHSPITHDRSPAENAAIAHMKELRAHAQRLADELSLIVRTVNDTLRHGLTVGQEEALTDCAKSSGKALEDFRNQ